VDVKFHNDQWKKVESSIQGLTQSGYFQLGQGIFSSLEDISKNLENLQDKIARYDSDGVVSFSHTNHNSKYKALNEDYAVLQEYSKKVGDLIEEKIDQPFYEDMDEFVETMRDATISNYSTTNRIDAKEEREYKDETGTYKFELDKKEVTIDDLFSGDNYYADKMMQEFTIWKQQSDKSETDDISYDDYRDVRMNSGAFQYKSIEDGQLSTEFWVNLGILGGVTIATILVPPAGAPLVAGLSGAGLGVLEASSAVTGKDWITQRDIAADERAIRGATSILGAVPLRAGAGAFRSFGSSLSATSVKDIAAVSKVTGKNLTNTAAKQGLTPHEMVQLTKQTDTLTDGANQTNSILRNNTISLMEWKEAKAIKQLQDAQYSKTDQLLKGTGTDGTPIMFKHSGSSNSVMYESGKVDTAGVGLRASGSVSKGTGNTVNDYLDDIIVKGDVDTVKMNKLKNAIQNNTFSVDELSEIRKRMFELGISKEYDEALIKIDFGKYLRGLIGDSPSGMIDPHAHHILFKKGLGDAQQKLVLEGQGILRKYGIEPVIGKENLVWAPNRIAGQHSISALENVVNQLKAVDAAGADLDDMIEILEDLGKQAASRR
jgi:hypothetical protein